VRAARITLARPEVLGFPAAAGQLGISISEAVLPMKEALVSGDEQGCRRIFFNQYLKGHTAAEVCDAVMAEAFHAIGDGWQCNEVEVYQERLACQICLGLLHEVRALLPPATQSLSAVGGTLQGDLYQLPTTMVEIVLREAGWQATSFGSSLPAETLCASIRDRQPTLFWLSASYIDDVPEFLRRYAMIYETAAACRAAVAVGGRALVQEVRLQMKYSAFCDTLGHLTAFIATLRPAAG